MICWCAFARMVFRVDSTDLVSAVLCPGLLQGFRARRLSLQRQRCAHLRFFANPGSAGILPAFSLLKHAAKMAALPGIVKARKISDAHLQILWPRIRLILERGSDRLRKLAMPVRPQLFCQLWLSRPDAQPARMRIILVLKLL